MAKKLVFFLNFLLFNFTIFGNNFDIKNEFCTISNIFNGSWSYGSKYFVPSNVYKNCPLLRHHLISSVLSDQPRKWACHNGSYYEAKFINLNCKIKSIHQSLRELQGKHLTLLGDSLMGQIYISLSCLAEQLGFHNKIKINYIHDLFLRPDVPCDPRCITNSTFCNEQRNSGIFNACFQCPYGIYREFNNSYEFKSNYWPTKVRLSNTTSLILGIGAWYNNFHQIMSPIETYSNTLQRNVLILNNLTKLGIKIYWIDTPPMPSCNILCLGYGWSIFNEYNNIAREIFNSTQIIYLNTSQVTGKRKFYDRNITPDYLHWCNPGHTTIPEFLGQIYLHLLSESLKEK